MSTIKETMKEIIARQPDDSSYDEILRELVFDRMVQRGLDDSDAGRFVSDDEVEEEDRVVAEIIWTLDAARWLEKIRDHISADSPWAAHGVVEGIYNKIQLLRNHPRLGQRFERIVDREVREILYGHYRIAYLVRSEDRVEILGIFHAAMEIERYLK